MTPKKGIDILMRRLGNRKDPKLREAILDEMNVVANSLERRPFLPWFLEKTAEDLILPEGAHSLTLPEDFLVEMEDDSVFLLKDNIVHSAPTKVDRQDLKKMYPQQSATMPRYYALFGNKFLFGNPSDKEYTVHLTYLAGSRVIETSEDEDEYRWLTEAGEYFITEVGAIIADTHIQNPDMAQRFAQRAAGLRTELYRLHEARQHTNRDYSLGEGNVS